MYRTRKRTRFVIRRHRLSLMVLGLFSWGMAPPTTAINIIPIYQAANSVPSSQDPSGTQLQAMFDYVESYYQGVFEDNHTVTINFWWGNLASGINGSHSLVAESGGRGIESNIRLSNSNTWFFDSTPADDSEFSVQQTFWRDLTSTEQSNYFNNFGANTPATFEVGYRGNAMAGGPADGVFDLLSTVIHEVGHALGLTGATNTDLETNDGDYDFTSSFVFGQPLAAEHRSGDRYHLDDPLALMCGGCGVASLRRRPSHTDLFAMASANDYVSVDAPRREFYGGSSWNTPGNWSGNQVPASNDDAFVRNAGSTVTANLNAASAAANLTVAEGSNVQTQAFKLDVGGTVIVRDLNSDLSVATGGELEASAILIQDGGDLNVEGGLIDANSITISTGTNPARLTGTGGTVDVQTSLVNNGTIQALAGGTLTFNSAGGAVWNLDGNTGSGTGIVRATTGDLHFATGSLTDAFDGTMEVGDFVNARSLTIAQPWSLAAGGTINLVGGNTAPTAAVLQGGQILAQGTINA
ncbi:MAG TPA: hypothetical protein VIY86_01615, partial [Pirellulaceae bacterium]